MCPRCVFVWVGVVYVCVFVEAKVNVYCNCYCAGGGEKKHGAMARPARSPPLDQQQILLGACLRIQLYLQQVVCTERTEYLGELLFSPSARMR